MNALVSRTRSGIALGIAVVSIAAVSLAGAPAAVACPIDADGTCLSTWTAKHTSSTPTKAKTAKHKKAPARHHA